MNIIPVDFDEQMSNIISEQPSTSNLPKKSSKQQRQEMIIFLGLMYQQVEQIATNPAQYLKMYEKASSLERQDIDKCLQIYCDLVPQHDGSYRAIIQEFRKTLSMINRNNEGAKNDWNLIRSSCQDSFTIGIGVYLSDEIARQLINSTSQQWKSVIFIAVIWILIELFRRCCSFSCLSGCFPFNQCITAKKQHRNRLLNKTPAQLDSQLQQFKEVYKEEILSRRFTMNLERKITNDTQQFIRSMQKNEKAQQQIEKISVFCQRYRIILVKLYQRSQLNRFQKAISSYYQFKLSDALARKEKRYFLVKKFIINLVGSLVALVACWLCTFTSQKPSSYWIILPVYFVLFIIITLSSLCDDSS